MKGPVHTGGQSSFALCQVFQKTEPEVSMGGNKLDTVLIQFNAMQLNAMKKKFHYRDSAFVAYVSYRCLVKKT